MTVPTRNHLDATGTRLHDQIDELREHPAVRVALRDGVTAWAVTDGELVRSLLTDPRVSRDPRRHWPDFDPGAQPSWLVNWTSPSMFNAYGDDHTRLRRLVARAFTARSIGALRPTIESIVAARLDALAEAWAAAGPTTPVDLRALFSYSIPFTVICDLFGVPADRRSATSHAVDRANDMSLTTEDANANGAELIAQMVALLEYKRGNPGDDLTTRLLALHDEDGTSLTADELVATLMLFMGAGAETTVSLIDHAVVNLLVNPAALAIVRRDATRWPDVIEETLRLESPAPFLPLRYAVDEIVMPDGTVIDAGEPIIIGFGAHGRDPAVHAEPTTWRLDRATTDHLAFGHGVHFCVGAPLARMQAAIALAALFDRFPTLALAVAPELLRRLPSFTANDYSEIPVRLTA